MRSSGIEMQPCLSRYIHRVPSSVYNGGCYSEACKGVVVVFFKCEICKFEIYIVKLNTIQIMKQKSILQSKMSLEATPPPPHDFEVDGIYYKYNGDGTVSVTFKGSSHN